jgi:hypothetical protein
MARTVLSGKRELPRHSPRRRAFACLPYPVFKPLGVGRLAGHLLDSLHLRAACHTIQAVHIQHYRGSELKAVQIRNLAFPSALARIFPPVLSKIDPAILN